MEGLPSAWGPGNEEKILKYIFRKCEEQHESIFLFPDQVLPPIVRRTAERRRNGEESFNQDRSLIVRGKKVGFSKKLISQNRYFFLKKKESRDCSTIGNSNRYFHRINIPFLVNVKRFKTPFEFFFRGKWENHVRFRFSFSSNCVSRPWLGVVPIPNNRFDSGRRRRRKKYVASCSCGGKMPF